MPQAPSAPPDRTAGPSGLIEQSPHPVLRVGRAGELLYANPSSAPVLAAWGIAVGDRVPSDVEGALARAANGDAETLEIAHDARVYRLEPVAAGAGVVNLWGRDVTAAREAERVLIEARDAAEAASAAKSDFLASMSHELRTPMNTILGYSEILLEELRAEGDTQRAGDLSNILDAGNHLLALINDVLDLSKIEAGRMQVHVEPVDVAALVEGVADTVAPLIEKSGNTLTIMCAETLPIARTDATKLRQMLFNLLSNATKFTEGGTITLSVRALEVAGRLHITVTDTGIGMSSEALARVFNPFTQADASTTRRYGGTGLGLTLCKRYCELIGGRLDAASTEGEGTTFALDLPLVIDEVDASVDLRVSEPPAGG